ATVYSLDRDAQVRSEIDAALSFVDSRLRSPHGGFAEGFPATLPRRQNPQMHLFEAMIALFDATHDLAFQQRAGEFFGLFMASLYDKQKQALGEYFEEDWSKIEPVVVDAGDIAGNITHDTRRLWPQTEIAKAWIAQAESGEEGAADKARAALSRLERHYLSHPGRGGWYDQFDSEGKSLIDTIPASSFYH